VNQYTLYIAAVNQYTLYIAAVNQYTLYIAAVNQYTLYITAVNQVVDFGYATKLQPPSFKATDPVGTPGYAAPEVLRRLEYGFQADIFSVGVIVYNLLSGCRPFDGPTVKRVLESTLSGEVTFDRETWGCVSEVIRH
ncbi:unnamed protein product, partial [Discosporangium mesarthrocarpum]